METFFRGKSGLAGALPAGFIDWAFGTAALGDMAGFAGFSTTALAAFALPLAALPADFTAGLATALRALAGLEGTTGFFGFCKGMGSFLVEKLFTHKHWRWRFARQDLAKLGGTGRKKAQISCSELAGHQGKLFGRTFGVQSLREWPSR